MALEQNKQQVKELDDAWSALEKSISSMGEFIRNETQDQDAQQRYQGYKTVLSMMSENYLSQLYADRQRPEFLPFLGSIYNYAGPSPDMLYLLVQLDPKGIYRVWGNRGDANLIDFQQLENWYGQNAEKLATVTVANELFDEKGLSIGDDGGFDFILSAEKPADARDGHWWQLGDGAAAIVVREYFTDYAKQNKHTTYHIERLDQKAGPTSTNAKEGAERINAFARALENYKFTFAMPKVIVPQVGHNQFFELNFNDAAAASDQRYIQACFDIKPDQALVGKWVVPEDFVYWSAALYNNFYQMFNYGHRQVNLNPDMSSVTVGRELTFVLSHQDPGIANWLDCDGHQLGQILLRTKGASDFDVPSFELVSFDELEQHLPENIERVSSEQRAKDLAVRLEHFQIREGR